MLHTRFFLEEFSMDCYNAIGRGQFHFVEQGDTEVGVDHLPVWKGEFITDSVSGKLNSVNTSSQMLAHISFSLYWRTEQEKIAVMLKTAPVAAVPRTAKETLKRPKSCWLLQPRACRDEMLRDKISHEEPHESQREIRSQQGNIRKTNFKAALICFKSSSFPTNDSFSQIEVRARISS